MKKLTLILVAVAFTCISQAQITITGADMPQAGQAFTLGYDGTPGVSPGSASANSQNWDFSGLTMDYPKFAVYSSTQPYHQYQNDFVDANAYTYGPSYMYAGLYGGAPVDQSAWGYLYWKSNNDGFAIVGFRGDYGEGYKNVLSEDQELLMGAPASLDSVFTDTGVWSVTINHDPADYDTTWVSRVEKTLTVDAWGQLTTTYGTFDVIRVHEYFIGIDSAIASYMGYEVGWEYYNDTLNNYYFWANGVGYPVATVHCDKNNTVIDVEFMTSKDPAYAITGQVFEPDGATVCPGGTVELIGKDDIDHLFGVPETVSIMADGRFQFSYVTYGNWLFLADADEAVCPNTIPTYYGNSSTWAGATVTLMNQDVDVSITLIGDSSAVMQNGSGSITGTIWVDTVAIGGNKDLTNAGRAGNVKVTLEENAGGAALLSGSSDDNGDYEFLNLSDGEYKLRVEIPGIHMDSTYSISVSNGALVHDQMDFIYDTVYAYIFEGTVIEETPLSETNLVNIYPNPFRDVATVSVSDMDSEFSYDFLMYDMSGKVVRQWSGTTYNDFKISAQGMGTGIYVFELRVDNQSIHRGKILVEQF